MCVELAPCCRLCDVVNSTAWRQPATQLRTTPLRTKGKRIVVELHYRHLSDVAADIRSGALSAVEVTQHTLDRIARLDPRLHAFAFVRGDDALRDAEDADARRTRGDALGPLHGVPVAVKDLCAMAGTPTRAGGFFSTGFSSTDTATVVTRLQDAGAIIIAKAQLTEGAWGSHHPDVATPVNPWAEDRWSGASSSGSGVSVAAGLAYGAVGTDTAGSIRFPSAANHLVGLKPTWGRVSRHGVFPLSDTFDHVGPMARSVLDAALLYEAMAGLDPLDVTSLTEPVGDCASAARRRGFTVSGSASIRPMPWATWTVRRSRRSRRPSPCWRIRGPSSSTFVCPPSTRSCLVR